jgi:hypothetical protein
MTLTSADSDIINAASGGRKLGRKRINHEQTVARVPKGTLQRIEDVLEPGEPQASFIREAIELALKRREAAKARSKRKDRR